MIDLHAHTTASDGEHPASELFALARAAGVTHLAVTDHDTVAGLEEAERQAAAHGVVLVPGLEISALLSGREVHVLGHFVDRRHPGLAGMAQRMREERQRRMETMVERVQKLGFPIRMAHVEHLAGDANLGRPHLARVFVEQGWCADVREAFDRFLGDGKPAYVDRYRLTTAEAIRLIRDAGGTATLAHPGVNRVERYELQQLRAEGLSGLEVHHGDHQPELREKYLRLAAEFDLVPTAGSDFHGARTTPNRKLGTADTGETRFRQLHARAEAPVLGATPVQG
ncbi:MAG: PHP domain-containing protein [Deltaproteobacteria bacterium]|nr:PHP domain-containing protein [Deltaproteobacteria bacterium]